MFGDTDVVVIHECLSAFMELPVRCHHEAPDCLSSVPTHSVDHVVVLVGLVDVILWMVVLQKCVVHRTARHEHVLDDTRLLKSNWVLENHETFLQDAEGTLDVLSQPLNVFTPSIELGRFCLILEGRDQTSPLTIPPIADEVRSVVGSRRSVLTFRFKCLI